MQDIERRSYEDHTAGNIELIKNMNSRDTMKARKGFECVSHTLAYAKINSDKRFLLTMTEALTQEESQTWAVTPDSR